MDNNDKRRTLYLAKILYERTDEEHSLNTPQLVKILKDEYGISAHRQTIPGEIELLKEFGLDIDVMKSNQNRYRILSREFDLAELKLITDAIGACKFIPKKKSKVLAEKVAKLTSENGAKKLKSNVSAEGRVRSTNEKAYLIADVINTAINERKKIRFIYYKYGMDKKKVPKHDGMDYVISPYGLVWDGDRYYTVGYSDNNEEIRTYRVDRILERPEMLEESAVKKPKNFDIDKYVNSSFHMYNGTATDVELKCDVSTMDSIVDRFGEKVNIIRKDEGTFTIRVTVGVSHVFYSWVFGFNGGVKIASPKEVADGYKKMLTEAIERA